MRGKHLLGGLLLLMLVAVGVITYDNLQTMRFTDVVVADHVAIEQIVLWNGNETTAILHQEDVDFNSMLAALKKWELKPADERDMSYDEVYKIDLVVEKQPTYQETIHVLVDKNDYVYAGGVTYRLAQGTMQDIIVK